jgi:protein gp37
MTSIEWTRGEDGTEGKSWNPVRGCVKISPGCKHCYAETFAERWRGVPGHAYEQGFDLKLVPHKLGDPLHWRKPRRIFVNSMSDLFQDGVPFEYIAACYGVMAACPQHTFQVLTKRPERRQEWAASDIPIAGYACGALSRIGIETGCGSAFEPDEWPLPNVWEGVSVEDRKYGKPRIDILRNTHAAVRFVSAEPLLEDLGELDLRCIDWVIVGAESGNRARPMREEWVRSIRDQAIAAGAKFFLKQYADKRGRAISLPVLDGRQWAEFPQQARPHSGGEGQ